MTSEASGHGEVDLDSGTSPNRSAPQHIQATWTDLSNITRCLMTTPELYESHFKQNGFSLPYFILSFPYTNGFPYERVTGEVVFRPDTEPPRPLPWMKETAITFGQFYNGAKPWDCCPRSFLIRQEQQLQKFSLQMSLGFEIEFHLFNIDGSPLNCAGAYEVSALRGAPWKFLSNVISALKELRIPVWKYHPEAGCSQYEISIGPFKGSLLTAADSLVLSCQAIYFIAAEHGLKATLLPKPNEQSLTSSIHTTISLWNAENKNYFEVCPQQANSFLAGVFTQLPNLMAVFCPNVNSYDRHHAIGFFSGTFHCIGTENRKAAIRVFRDQAIINRFEVRCPDGTSNPYLVVGSFIAAGIDGIENGHQLPEFVDVDPQTLAEAVRPLRLPTSLTAAIKAFTDSTFNRQLFGEELFRHLATLRKGDDAYWTSSEEKMENKMKLLLSKY